MKKILFTILTLQLFLPHTRAQDNTYLKIENPEVTLLDSIVRLTFEADADRKANRRGATVVYLPRISDGDNTVCFPPVVVQGKRSQIAWDRHTWAAGSTETYGEAVYMKRGASVRYQSDVQLQWWMYGAELSAEYLVAGCCSTDEGRTLLASNVLPAPEPESIPEPVIEIAEQPELTVGEELAEVFSFVLHESEYDAGNPLKMYDDERDGGIIIYYLINRHLIEPDYADNRQTLKNLLAAIDIIQQSDDSRVSRVFVAGFASPDGPYEYNDRLAWERAVSVKEYILKNSDLPDDFITLYNGSADWQGLRLLVVKDRTMPRREQVLEIIDNYPIWDSRTQTGRMGRIMQLDGGEVYRYMAGQMFPKLRNGAFIRVYFNNNNTDN